VDAVTGAFSYTGSAIARELLARDRPVRTLVRSPRSAGHPLAERVEVAPLRLDDEAALVSALTGIEVLYNTFWIRFARGGSTFEWAIAASARLFRAAAAAGVERIVHISVTKPSLSSPYAYFRAKAAVDELVLGGPVPATSVRPSLIFGGRQEILVNNIAWFLRHSPAFAVPRRPCRVQPVHVDDVARIAADAGESREPGIVDAVGPETFTYRELVERIGAAVGSRARIVALPERAVAALGRGAGAPLRDTVVTGEELGALTASLLTSDEPPLGRARFSEWLDGQADWLGREYHSELERHWRRR
jgi:NADH dehydrogenase